MTDLCRLIFWTLVDLMRARATLEAEIWVLRQQINVLRRAAPRRQSFSIFDRLIFGSLSRLFPRACDALAIVKPDTIIRWHRAGFRAYWRWKSRRRGGRPTVPPEIRKLILAEANRCPKAFCRAKTSRSRASAAFNLVLALVNCI